MTFELRCLHRNGVKLTLEELATAQRHTGILVIEDLHNGVKDGRFFRARFLASLALHEAPRDVIPPLFDGRIGRSDGMLKLQGYQFYADISHGIRRHAQEWALRKLV